MQGREFGGQRKKKEKALDLGENGDNLFILKTSLD